MTMLQLSLLDTTTIAPLPDRRTPPPAPARRTDPCTSATAARRVTAAGGALEQAIVDAVADALEPITADEIADRVCADHVGRWGRSTVLTAVSRARTARRIVAAGTGTTSRGVTAVAYAPVQR